MYSKAIRNPYMEANRKYQAKLNYKETTFRSWTIFVLLSSVICGLLVGQINVWLSYMLLII